jgi:hypothetical protein
MATIVSKFAAGTLPTLGSGCAGVVISQDYFVDLTAAQIEANQVIDMGLLPAGYTVTDVVLAPDDLDSASAITLDVGLLSGTPGDTANRTCGAEIFSGSTAAQTGAVARPTLKSAFNIKPSNEDRSIGVKIAVDAGTAVAGRIRLRVLMHAADANVQF